MRPILGTVAALLERVEVVDPDRCVRGDIGGQKVTFELGVTSLGSVTVRWTEVRVGVESGLSLLLSVRPRTPALERDAARGLALDLRLDDRAFDAAFIVEGAPERVVREVVDEEVRRSILVLRPEHVLTTSAEIVVQMPDFVQDSERAAALVRLAARMGVLAAEVARRNLADAGRLDTSGYRGELSAGIRAKDDAEIEALRRVVAAREARRRSTARRVAVGVGIAALVVALSIAWLLAR